MLAWILGIVLFAIGICLSVALHEAGHMWAAKAFGMKVRRYFIGFGPKIWSFRRGETEYGLKAIPLGGFCDIAGMTAMDELTPDEEPRAMYRYPVWKRVTVMAAGILMQFVLGFVILYFAAISVGLPNLGIKPIDAKATAPVVAQISPCVGETDKGCPQGAPAPAKTAGLLAGDTITSVNGKPTKSWDDVKTEIAARSGPTPLTVSRGGQVVPLTVDVAKVNNAGAIGVRVVTPDQGPEMYHYNGLSGLGGAATFTGDLFARTWEGLMRFPEKIPKVVEAIGGGERDKDTPVSVVGASVIGGDAVERGLWELFLLLLASLNFFMGVFNILPLLPLDGGHIAIALYEKVRDTIRRLRGKPAGGPVDYTKLTGVTMVIVFIGAGIVLLTVTADIVNPIRIGQ
ncbi:RIP metalloprotease RseP [Herbihabitans rhizosphaerae]|uniref:RIP metalloprotease RseP n=1 Tax=Herbihabitans rhizosphaerae TaxID=1872711 RepID=A0A4Q7KIG5_9PSEU|nr:site-2 protease family protein [Herbihabitans rhizosphaerae]RZS34710.1 RIP metalloprotease RseP [Herbihabitans rhizosphaerae]